MNSNDLDAESASPAKEAATPVVIDTTHYSEGFPRESWKSIIARTNYIAEIEDGIANNIDLYFIEGEEDSGKTIVASQFARKYVDSTVSIFFNPLNNLDFKIEYFCRNTLLQIKHLLKEPIDEAQIPFISTEEYQQALYPLRKLAKKSKHKKINFVIDGLEVKVKEDPEFIRELFSILPFGQDTSTIIISGNKNDFVSVYNQLRKQDSKSIHLTGFTEGEVAEYLNVPNPGNSFKDIYKVTKGYPGRLKTLKRLIDSEGYSLDQITASTSYTTWLAMDCENLDLKKPQNNLIISLLCLKDRAFTIGDISKICDLTEAEVEQTIKGIAIFDIVDKTVVITSAAHKRYLAGILKSNKAKVDELLIVFYADVDNDSLDSLIELPVLYSNKNRHEKVIEILDEQYLNKILNKTGSLQPVTDTLQFGVAASEKLSRYPDLLRYSVQGSIVNELDNYLFWESEIEARISIQDFTGAVALAESAVVSVDRLRLLALIARRQKEFNDKVDEGLTKLIEDLYKTIDLTDAGDKIYDIVTHLIYGLPNLAIEIIEKSSGDVSNKSINDWVVAKLSIAAIDSEPKSSQKTGSSKKLDAIQNLNNPSVKKINRAIAFLVGNYTAERVLDEVDKIADAEEKLKLLRLWLENNRSNVDRIEDVIEAALRELIMTSSETTVSMDVLNELSSQLPYVKDRVAKERLYRRFKSIENDLSDLGMGKTRFIFRLNMFHTEYFLNKIDAIKTVTKIIFDIDLLDDMLVKLEAFAETYAKLRLFQNEFKPKIDFIYRRILTLSKSLYDTTASQFKISEHFLATIGKQNPVMALKIIREMNNVERRERSRVLVWESYLKNSLKHVKIDILKELESSFESAESKSVFYIDVLERYSEANSLTYNTILEISHYVQGISAIREPENIIRGYLLAYKILNKNDKWKSKLSQKYETLIYNSWKALEADWEKIDQGFSLCYELAKFNAVLSKKIFQESEEIKKRSWLDSRLVAYTFLNSIKVVIRAYYGLMNARTNLPADFQAIDELITKVPSEIEKLQLWTEVGFWALQANEENIFKKVVNDHVSYIVHTIANNKDILEPALDALTLIHISDPKQVERHRRKLSQDVREASYAKICDYYVTKRNPYEAYDYNVTKYNPNFTDLSKAIKALEEIRTDSRAYFLLSHISDAIQAGYNKEISKIQVTDLTDQLSKIANKRFPDPKNIKHDGFKLLAELKIAKASKHESQTSSMWGDFAARANKIPNLSDRVFVNSILIDGDSDEPDHLIPAQADHQFRGKLTRGFRDKLTTLNV